MNKEWNILKLECKTSENGLTNIVQRIQWNYKVTETVNGQEYSSEISGPLDLPSPSQENFTPFESLTNDQVVLWIESTMGIDQVNYLNNLLLNNINEQVSPTVVYLDPPF